MTHTTRGKTAALVVAVGLLVAGCGTDSEDGTGPTDGQVGLTDGQVVWCHDHTRDVMHAAFVLELPEHDPVSQAMEALFAEYPGTPNRGALLRYLGLPIDTNDVEKLYEAAIRSDEVAPAWQQFEESDAYSRACAAAWEATSR